MNLCLLEVAMCKKCRSSHFHLEAGIKSFEDWGEGNFRTGGISDLKGSTFAVGRSVAHYMPCTSKPWITTEIADSIKSKNKIYKKCCKEKKNPTKGNLQKAVQNL